jgi:hypothetical protein
MKAFKFKKIYDLVVQVGTPVAFILIALSEGWFYWIAGVMTVLMAGQFILNRVFYKN